MDFVLRDIFAVAVDSYTLWIVVLCFCVQNRCNISIAHVFCNCDLHRCKCRVCVLLWSVFVEDKDTDTMFVLCGQTLILQLRSTQMHTACLFDQREERGSEHHLADKESSIRRLPCKGANLQLHPFIQKKSNESNLDHKCIGRLADLLATAFIIQLHLFAHTCMGHCDSPV